MARKGSRKVRTGCLTCKIRKIKCDEGKPFCNRCTSTGRRCDGYSTDAGTTLRWQPQSSQALQFQLDANVPEDEARALQFCWIHFTRPSVEGDRRQQVAPVRRGYSDKFFSENVGPFISGPTDPYFWTHLIVQASNNEPAVRHSVIAISFLYDDIQTGASPHLDDVALSHYNAAIYELNDSLYQNKELVLLVCILFVCIEFLQSNKEAAIRHCNHGLAILESSRAEPTVRDHLLPIFRRLCGFPLMFGTGHLDFPDLNISRCMVPSSFATFSQAQGLIDDLFNQMVQLKRHDDMYRVGELRHEVVPREMYQEKERTMALLRQWHRLFADLDARSKSASTRIRGAPRIYALMRYEVCKSRIDMAFQPDEAGYDRHVDGFRRIVEEATKFAETLGGNSHPPHFLFESGFTPLLFFIGSKCRALDVRLEALRLVGVLGSPREMMWERAELHAVCRRLVEMEHGVALDAYGQLEMTQPDSCLGFPPEEMRVLHFVQHDATAVHRDSNGEEFFGRNVGFLLRAPDGTVFMHSEIVADSLPQISMDREYSSSPPGEM